MLAPESFDVHLLMGDLLLDAERLEDAEASYRKALALNQSSSAAHHKLAEVLRLQGQFDASIVELREVMRLDPTSAGAHTDLALILGAQDKAEDALAEGLVSEVVAPDELMGRARAKAEKLAAKAPHYVRMAKVLVGQSIENGLTEHLQLERHGIADSMATEDLRNGVTAFFGGGTPKFEGR